MKFYKKPKRPAPIHCDCGKVSYPRKEYFICRCGKSYRYAKAGKDIKIRLAQTRRVDNNSYVK